MKRVSSFTVRFLTLPDGMISVKLGGREIGRLVVHRDDPENIVWVAIPVQKEKEGSELAPAGVPSRMQAVGLLLGLHFDDAWPSMSEDSSLLPAPEASDVS